MKILLYCAASAFGGMLLGGLIVLQFTGTMFSDSLELLGEGSVYQTEEMVFDAYRNEPRPTATWALFMYSNLLDREEVRASLGDRWHCEKLVTLARLVKLVSNGDGEPDQRLEELVLQAERLSSDCSQFRSETATVESLSRYAKNVDQVRLAVELQEGVR
ncbi:MAG: hypothetical protein ACF788_06930 [Novipirellula sp. JB048]